MTPQSQVASKKSPYDGKGFDLGEDAVRLVQLHRGLENDPIECTLIVTRYLGSIQGIPYEALSYTWGDESIGTSSTTPTSTQINLDGISFEVSRNLAAALTHLRQPAEDRLLWVDAICINQVYKQEKTHQVKRMRHIYESAERVIIWLGPGNENTDLLMQTACELDKRAGVRKAWNQEWHMMKHKAPLCEDDELEKRVLGLQDLLGRSWFHRVWVIQEAASNQRAIITCGWRSVSSRTFSLLPLLLRLDHSLDPHTTSILEVMPGTLRKTSWWQRDRSLARLLLKFGNCEATDEKDRLYALFGISNDFYDNSVLSPDYNISIQQLIQNITWALLFGKLPAADLRLPPWDWDTFLDALRDLPAALFNWALVSSADAVLKHLFVGWGSGTKGIIGRSDNTILHRMLPLHSLIRTNSRETLGAINTYLGMATVDLVNVRDGDGDGPLHLAVSHENLQALSLLLQHKGIEVNATNLLGRSPLDTAVLNSHGSALKLLLQHPEINVNFTRAEKPTRTPLMEAANSGFTDIVQTLLNHPGVDINYEAEDFATSLGLAIERGHMSVVELLLQHPLLQVNGNESSPNTPLNMAIARGEILISEKLINHSLIDLNRKGTSGDTALHTAVRNQRSGLVQLLLSRRNININCCNDDGYSPLHLAVWMNRLPEVDLLLKHPKTDVNYVGDHSESRTALWWTVHRENIESFNALLQHKDIHVHHTSGTVPAPLQLTARYGYVDITERLLAKASLQSKIDRLPTGEDILGAALVQAAYFGHHHVAKILLDKAIEMHRLEEVLGTVYRPLTSSKALPYFEPVTPLHAAIEQMQDLDMVRVLVSAGADVNTPNQQQLTPLWRAIWRSHQGLGLTELLLQHGADPEQPVKTRTHLNLAASRRLPQVCALLMEHGACVNATGSSGISPLLAVFDFQHLRLLCSGYSYKKGGVVRELIMNEKFFQFMAISAFSINTKDTEHILAHMWPKQGKDTHANREDTSLFCPVSAEEEFSKPRWNEIDSLEVHFPSQKYQLDCLATTRVILKNGGNIEAVNNQGVTALWIAVCQNNIEVVKELLLNGADVEVSDPDHNRTSLWIAALLDYGEIVSLLLMKGANAWAKCKEGKSAVTIAAEKGCLHSTQALLQSGKVEHDIEHSLGIARFYGHAELVLVLEEHIRAATNGI